MSLNITYQVTKMDNCDQKTTILTCKNEAGATVEVEIDPVDLFENMLENLGANQYEQSRLEDLINAVTERNQCTQETITDEYDEVQADKIDMYRNEH